MSTSKERTQAHARARLLGQPTTDPIHGIPYEGKERGIVAEGDELFCILRSVSGSGMRRVIQVVKFETDAQTGRLVPFYLGWLAADALGWKYDQKAEGVIVGGTGMDMGFHLVYELSHALFGNGYALTHRWL